MVDQEKTLASVLLGRDGESTAQPHDETAIWDTGETNNLVVVLKALFTWQLEDNREDSGWRACHSHYHENALSIGVERNGTVIFRIERRLPIRAGSVIAAFEGNET